MSSARIALAVNGHLSRHLGVNVVDRDRLRDRPLCRGQVDSKKASLLQTKDREGTFNCTDVKDGTVTPRVNIREINKGNKQQTNGKKVYVNYSTA